MGSILWEDGSLRLYALADSMSYVYLHNGLRLLEAAKRDGGLERLYLDEWTKEFPGGGFHIDIAAKTLELWFATDAADVERRIAPFWPEWSVKWHRDRYEFQLERVGDRLRFPAVLPSELEERLRGMLLRADERSSVGALLDAAELWEAEGSTVELNPLALRENPLHLPISERERLLNQALAAVRSA